MTPKNLLQRGKRKMVAKVVGFVGSPRKGGNTDLLVQAALQGAGDAGANTSIYYLDDYDIRGCKECMNCKEPDAKACVIKDDMQQFYPIIKEADVFVFGSPFWFGYMTGQAKTFLDRWNFFIRGPNPLPGGKKWLLVLPLGRNEPQLFGRTARWMASVLPFAFPKSTARVETLLAPGVFEKAEVEKHPEYLEQAYQMGRQIVQD
ncbi:flavodoxin family protein [Chloroflexota bacterium]